MDDDRAREVAIDHLAAGKDSVSTQDAVESAMIEQAEIKKGIDQRGMGKIYVAKGAPCQVGCNDLFLGEFQVLEFAVCKREINHA